MNKEADIKPKNHPISGKERIDDLDLYRGFAILGIFTVNILVMNVSFAFRQDWNSEQTGWSNEATFFMLQTFFYGKFFTIFSLLFGIGVALQMHNTSNKSMLFFLRRFGALFVFGILHMLFIWYGDILHLYALLGILLLFFIKMSAKYLLWSAIFIFLFPYFSEPFDWLMDRLSFYYWDGLTNYSRNDLIELVRNGSHWSGVELRIKEYSFGLKSLFTHMAPVALSMMLIGGYIVKKGLVFKLKTFAKEITKPLLITTGILLVYRFTLLYYIVPDHAPEWGSILSLILHAIYKLSDVAISFSLLWGLTLLHQQKVMRKVLEPLKHVGRLALTNYILQSVFGYLIMRTFGYYEAFSLFECLGLVFIFFGLQVAFSKLYLKNFRFGPLEWVWRILSYGKLFSILIKNKKKPTADQHL